MKVLRTPEERFENLPDYPFEPHYAEIPDLEGIPEAFLEALIPWLESTPSRR